MIVAEPASTNAAAGAAVMDPRGTKRCPGSDGSL